MFVLENLRSTDQLQLARAETFLLENPDEGVRPRPKDQIAAAIATGQGVQISHNGDICGLSLVYKFDTSPIGRLYSEIGTMRVTANGYGLQTFLAKFHLIQLELEEFYDDPGVVFAVVTPGTASEHNLIANVGMKPWAPPPELAATRQASGLPFLANKNVLCANEQSVRAAFLSLSSWHKSDRAFMTPKGEAVIEIITQWFAPEVLAHSP